MGMNGAANTGWNAILRPRNSRVPAHIVDRAFPSSSLLRGRQVGRVSTVDRADCIVVCTREEVRAHQPTLCLPIARADRYGRKARRRMLLLLAVQLLDEGAAHECTTSHSLHPSR